MRLIIAGSRTFCDRDVVFAAIGDALASWFPVVLALTPATVVSEVVSGLCPTGVDPLGELWAKEHGIPVKGFLADWGTHGNAAGPMRNAIMAKYAAAGEAGGALVAIWQRRSPGTGGMIRLAKAAGLLVHVKETR